MQHEGATTRFSCSAALSLTAADFCGFDVLTESLGLKERFPGSLKNDAAISRLAYVVLSLQADRDAEFGLLGRLVFETLSYGEA
jgi:hypothetical protein